MINSPGDRTAAARQVLESFGGSLECLDLAKDAAQVYDVPGQPA
jgi:hypothetical protein